MANVYTYPRVSIKTTAMPHSSVAPEAEDTTVLFVPIATKKGPEGLCQHNIHSLSEFISIYGELDYDVCGQAALNVYNWLRNGGTLCVYRLTTEGKAKSSDSTYGLEAKYPGNYYGDLKVTLIKRSSKAIDVYVSLGTTVVESFSKLTYKNILSVLAASEYIDFSKLDLSKIFTNQEVSISDKVSVEFAIANSKLSDTKTEIDKKILAFWKAEVDGYSETTDVSIVKGKKYYTYDKSSKGYTAVEEESLSSVSGLYEEYEGVLQNPLVPNIDIIMDAGYSDEIKEQMCEFIKRASIDTDEDQILVDDQGKRPDLVGIFDSWVLAGKLTQPTVSTYGFPKSVNIAVYEQFFTISDAIFTDQDIYVCPSYFLSKLIPYNDLQYGVQYPTAGLRRGILDDAIAINENPMPSKKEQWFNDRINYVEKTSREYSFMSQRTHDGSDESEYTALSFLNNVRALEKMKKDIRNLGREYLFEFNDSTTLSKMSNVLNKYITNWVSNRTLSSGVVTVSKNAYSDEAVDVEITIKFNGTIEVISVNITIE